jgi:hypothetical protein
MMRCIRMVAMPGCRAPEKCGSFQLEPLYASLRLIALLFSCDSAPAFQLEFPEIGLGGVVWSVWGCT